MNAISIQKLSGADSETGTPAHELVDFPLSSRGARARGSLRNGVPVSFQSLSSPRRVHSFPDWIEPISPRHAPVIQGELRDQVDIPLGDRKSTEPLVQIVEPARPLVLFPAAGSGTETAALAVLSAAAVVGMLYGLACSIGLVQHWGTFQAGIERLLP